MSVKEIDMVEVKTNVPAQRKSAMNDSKDFAGKSSKNSNKNSASLRRHYDSLSASGRNAEQQETGTKSFREKIGCKPWCLPFFLIMSISFTFPVAILVVIVWYLSIKQPDIAIHAFMDVVKETDEEIVFKKMDALTDTAAQIVKNYYAGSVAVVSAGALIDQNVKSLDHHEKIIELTSWTQSLSNPFHYDLLHFSFACNGHLYGTGYSEILHQYNVMFPYLDYYVDGETFNSNNGVTYYDGCTSLNEDTQSSYETHYRTEFSTETGWEEILELDNYNGTLREEYFDVRSRDWYKKVHHSSTGCAWSDVYVSTVEPYPITNTFAQIVYDEYGVEFSTVGVDFSLDDIQRDIGRLNGGITKLSTVIINKEGRTLTSSDGDVSHPIVDVCAEATAELYTLGEYGSLQLSNTGNERYKLVSDYVLTHPEFVTALIDHKVNILEDNIHAKPDHAKTYNKKGEPVLISGTHITDDCGLDLDILIVVEENELLEVINKNVKEVEHKIAAATEVIVAIIISIVAVFVLFALLISRLIMQPLTKFKRDIGLVTKLDFRGNFEKSQPFISELRRLQLIYTDLKMSLKECKCFVPTHIIKELVHNAKGATVRKVQPMDICVHFCDVINSHRIDVDPQVIADFASTFIGGASDIMVSNNGTVIDFFAEQIFGIFNAPEPSATFLDDAIATAIKVVKHFEDVRDAFAEDISTSFHQVQIRIGLHAGTALVGKIGSNSRLKYCAVGDSVNLGARIANLNGRYGSNISVSSDFYSRLSSAVASLYSARPMELVKVQGREDPVVVYNVLGLAEDIPADVHNVCEQQKDIFRGARDNTLPVARIEDFIARNPVSAKYLRSAMAQTDTLREVKKL